jgi:hypothetical protein
VVDFDSDGDGLNNALDSCDAHAQGAGKTNGCPIEGISVTAQPTVTGTPQVDSPLTATTGSAGNDPGLDPNVAAPAKAVQWFSCSSASGVGICLARTGTASSYTPTSADIGRFIRVTVTWTNSDGAEELANSSTTAAVTAVPSTPSGNTNPPSTPTTPAAPVNPLTLPTLPSKASFKGAVKKKGAINLPTFKIACASGGAACGVSVTLTYKKKTIGTLPDSIAPGTTQPLKAKLSAAGLKLVKKAKRGLKTTLTVTATSGGSGKATIKDFTITK